MKTELQLSINLEDKKLTIVEQDRVSTYSIVVVNNTAVSHTVADALEVYLLNNPRPKRGD